MNYLAFLVQVLPPLRGYCELPSASIITLEECQGISAGDDASTLVVEQGCRVPLEDRYGVTKAL